MQWHEIPGFNGRYQIANDGQVRRLAIRRPDGSVLPQKILYPSLGKNGYMYFQFSDGKGGKKSAYLHRLIAEAFIARVHGMDFVNHKDGVKTNNAIGNLEWCTHRGNMLHAISSGLMTPLDGAEKGEKCPSAKLSDAQVVRIKKRLLAGEMPASIARDFPVSSSAIGEIKAGRSWGHIHV